LAGLGVRIGDWVDVCRPVLLLPRGAVSIGQGAAPAGEIDAHYVS
jgi:hypothetical protein